MQPPAQHVCPRCGTPIQIGQLNCSQCGLALNPAALAAYQSTQTRPAPGPYRQAPVLARPRSNTRLIIILSTIGALLLTCVLCGIISAFQQNTPEAQTRRTAIAQGAALAAVQTATGEAIAARVVGSATAQARLLSARTTQTAAARPTDTPKPSATPKPSNTPRPPSATPLPPTETAVPPTETIAPPTRTPGPLVVCGVYCMDGSISANTGQGACSGHRGIRHKADGSKDLYYCRR